MTIRSGHCLCGQVHFHISAEPVIARLCWCRDCQRIAANGTANAIFPTDSIDITGTTAEFSMVADSGNTITRRFCPTCGSQLFADSTGRPGMTVVRLGVLDEPSSVTPTANIWVSSAPAWACLDGTLERVERQPPAVKAPGTT